MKDKKSIRQAFIDLIHEVLGRERFYLRTGKAKDVTDTGFTFIPDDGKADIPINNQVVGSSFIIKPVEDSKVLIGHKNKTQAFVISVNEADEIIFNGGENGGQVISESLTAKLNNLVSEIEHLKTVLDTHTHLGVTVGSGVTGTPTPFVANFSQFNKNDFTNEKIKQ